MRLFFISLLIAGPISALGAKSDEVVCTDFKNLEFVKIYNSEGDRAFPDYTCDDFQAFDSLAGSVFKLSPFPITDVNVMAAKVVPQTAGVDFTFDHLSIGFDKRRPELKPAIDAIITHELGHNIFTEFLYQRLPHLKELNNLRIENRGSAKVMLKFISLVDASGKCRSIECKSFAQTHGSRIERSQEIADEMNGWHERNKDLSEKLHVIIAPYHELVADIVTVLATKNPDSTRKAIRDVIGKDDICRGLNYDSKEIVTDRGPHCVFSGVRKSILTNFLFPAIANRSEGKALEQIMTLLTQEISYQLGLAAEAQNWKFDQQLALDRLQGLFK